MPLVGPVVPRTAGLRTTRARLLTAALVVVLAASCVGSGKTARGDSIEPLPGDLRVVADTTTGCRAGESGFDYRFLVIFLKHKTSYPVCVSD